MRYYPEKDYEWEDVGKIGLKKNDWKLNVLKMNPNYNSWGNYEGYMYKSNGDWESPVELENVKELWQLDLFNELINFHFDIYRKNQMCKECEGTGYNNATLQISKAWYDFDNNGTRWCDNISQNEVEALWNNGRLKSNFNKKPTAEEVNQKERKEHIHDAINRIICIEERAKSLNVWGLCKKCNGLGYIYTEDKIHLGLQMWFIHPRKGCSRGVYLKNIEKEEMPLILEYLKEANRRNNERFNKLYKAGDK